ncbi:MAG: methionyl aminopeptidase [Clostridiales bacterium]|jgi:methionyl aminopeptidase|nr:methionyl aminopeptidase [Clostridiales bacterium]
MDRIKKPLCWCGSKAEYSTCHQEFDEKIRELRGKGYLVPQRKLIKNTQQIKGIRESAKINIAVLDFVAQHIRAGVTTQQIDSWVHERTTHYKAVPAPLHFEGFPKSVCTSVNNQVCHGIPSSKVVLKEGDIVNVDVSTNYRGYYSDSSRMFCIGKVTETTKRLVDTAKECMELGLKQVRPWGFLGDIGQAVSDHAKKNGYAVVREIGGHGIGLQFHELPWVSYVSKRGTQMVMAPGMIFTIEPMINMGSHRIVIDQSNGWTVYTADGKPSAQWEIQVLVTEEGYEVLAY